MAINLTDNEKRGIIKFIEAGKPLPDKYRFLLFGEKGNHKEKYHSRA